MICPSCGGSEWETYSGPNAFHTHGLSVRCAGPANECWFAIHLTRDQMVEAAFLVTQHERTAEKEATL